MDKDLDPRRQRRMAGIAGHLDRRRRPDDPADAKIADEVRQDEAWLDSMMDVSVPPEVLQRTYAKLHESLAARRPRQRWVLPGAIGLAAAAMVTAAVLLNMLTDKPADTGAVALTAEEAVEVYLADEPSALDRELNALLREAEIALGELDGGFGGFSELDALEQRLGVDGPSSSNGDG